MKYEGMDKMRRFLELLELKIKLYTVIHTAVFQDKENGFCNSTKFADIRHTKHTVVSVEEYMFDKRNDYVMNKYNSRGIVYSSVTGRITLTPSDFSSEQEFEKWKKLSDENYKDIADNGRDFYNYCVMFNSLADCMGAANFTEDTIMSEVDDAKITEIYALIKAELTERQYRRFFLHRFMNIKQSDIARMEGVNQSHISESIEEASKKVEKILKKILA